MDFGRDMSKTPGIVAKSNIRLVDETALGDDPLDRQVCLKANEAARELFFGKDYTSSSSSSSSLLKQDNGNEAGNNTLNLIDCSLYDEQHLPPARHLIAPGDLVVVFESFNDLNFVYATPNDIFSNRNGHFHHNNFIGKPYGCKIRSKDNEGLGFLYLLRPTPELWARSLPHRTQIVHELDASMITHYLEISPNMTVCESGTGSGAMSHVILRSIAPRGKLHTYEFNKMRVTKARKEFEGHGLGHLVECHHRDVCGKKNLLAVKNGDERNESEQSAEEGNLTDSTTTDLDNNNNDIEEDEEDDGKGGFQLGQAAAHAIFLDLPEPWLAVPHAAYTIKPNGRICSYSPCMEQTQRTVKAMKEHGFHSIRTVEARLKEYYVDEYEMETPPSTLLEIPTEEAVSLEKERQVGGNQKPKEKEDKALNDEKGNNKKRSNVSSNVGPKNKILCARPFAHMRGHTAFLTFATASNTLRPDPNSCQT